MQPRLQCPLASSVRFFFCDFFYIVKVIYNGHWKTRGLVNAIRAGTLTESQFLRYVSNLLCSLARSHSLSCAHLFPPCLSPTFPFSLCLCLSHSVSLKHCRASPSWPLRPYPTCHLLWHASINGTYVKPSFMAHMDM
jgi:hypothetical protein